MVQSNRKGSSFEREIAKKLSLWMSYGRRDDLLWRTAMSGGRATLQRQKGKRALAQSGDLGSIAEESLWFTEKFFIETKHLKDINLTSFVLKGQGPLAAHLKKAASEAAADGKELFFVVRQNRYPTILIVQREIFSIPPLAVVGRFYFYGLDSFLEKQTAGLLREEMDGYAE